MTRRELVNLIEQYRAGIEAELALLRQLDRIASRQRDVTEALDFEAFVGEADARERITRSLVTIEEGLRRVRRTLSDSRDEARKIDGFEEAATLHREAAGMVAKILAIDHESLKALADAELARRAVMASLQRGETTLAAYRKVLAPPVASAAFVNRRG